MRHDYLWISMDWCHSLFDEACQPHKETECSQYHPLSTPSAWRVLFAVLVQRILLARQKDKGRVGTMKRCFACNPHDSRLLASEHLAANSEKKWRLWFPFVESATLRERRRVSRAVQPPLLTLAALLTCVDSS